MTSIVIEKKYELKKAGFFNVEIKQINIVKLIFQRLTDLFFVYNIKKNI